MPLPSSGVISISQVNTELGLSSTAQISLNDSAVRTLFGKASGAIAMSDGYGKANAFAFTISSNQSNANLRTLAVNAGWNQSSKVVATISSGIEIRSTSTGTPALTINGSFPGGVELVNGGTIVGMGGVGGSGGWGPNGTFSILAGSPGSAGGTALSVSVAASVRNNSIISGGGGGGGGGGLGVNGSCQQGGGGGGGGGNGYGGGGPAGRGDGNATAGSAGGQLSGGAGAPGRNYFGAIGGNGGAGGTNAASGGVGAAGAGGGSGGSAGAGGAAISGNSNITWLATGTRYGSIT